jgi:hypothetical protein
MLTRPVQTFFSRISQFFGGETPPDKRNRSRTGLLLTLALIPLLLGVLACFRLPVPVGDPEKSRIDPAMSGIWIGHLDGDAVIFVLDPYDKRTWLLSFISLVTGQDPKPAAASDAGVKEPEPETSHLRFLDADYELPIKIDYVGLFKSWLTKIKGVTFITWESKNLSDTLPAMVPDSWLVFRVIQSDENILYLDLFASETDGFDDVKTSKEAEKIIRRHVNDPEFYSPFLELHKVPESDYQRVSGLLEDFGITLK